MKFTNSPFAILDKNMNALDYQKRNLKYEDYWRREGMKVNVYLNTGIIAGLVGVGFVASTLIFRVLILVLK